MAAGHGTCYREGNSELKAGDRLASMSRATIVSGSARNAFTSWCTESNKKCYTSVT
jgi:hypothetical protein